MRATLRLLATVQKAQFLEAGAPTGLTGLATHGSPRTTLLYLYNATLRKLQDFPEHSVYRQSTEALTKHRLSIIEGIKPAGLSEWQERVKPLVEKHPNAFRMTKLISQPGSNDFNVVWKEDHDVALRDGEVVRPQEPGAASGPKDDKEWEKYTKNVDHYMQETAIEIPVIESEPALSVEQIGEIETKINAGLIEEVIEVARGEADLAHVLYESKVWEDLEDKPVEGQWTYYERDRHTAGSGTGQ